MKLEENSIYKECALESWSDFIKKRKDAKVKFLYNRIDMGLRELKDKVGEQKS